MKAGLYNLNAYGMEEFIPLSICKGQMGTFQVSTLGGLQECAQTGVLGEHMAAMGENAVLETVLKDGKGSGFLLFYILGLEEFSSTVFQANTLFMITKEKKQQFGNSQ